MSKRKIGCCLMVKPKNHSRYVGLECAKGRGNILPGGKLEDGETFKECALREFEEETGIGRSLLTEPKLVFHAIDESGYYCYIFSAELMGSITKNPLYSMNFSYHDDGSRILKKEFGAEDSTEGKVKLFSDTDFMKSKFKGFYELLFDKLEQDSEIVDIKERMWDNEREINDRISDVESSCALNRCSCN